MAEMRLIVRAPRAAWGGRSSGRSVNRTGLTLAGALEREDVPELDEDPAFWPAARATC